MCMQQEQRLHPQMVGTRQSKGKGVITHIICLPFDCSLFARYIVYMYSRVMLIFVSVDMTKAKAIDLASPTTH